MGWWSRWRSDLRRPEAPTRREELPFLVGSALLIAGLAQLSDPGSAGELAILAPAVLAFVLRGLLPRLPSEVFAVLVVVPVVLAVAPHGNLEVGFFLGVNMVLYSAWHLGSAVRAGLILVVSAAAPIVVAAVAGHDLAWTAWTSANLFTFVLGRNLRRQRLLIEELQTAREALAEAAVAAERKRIARELHDLAGHTLAAVLLHVTGARHVLRRDVDEAERALLDAEAVGRSSLDQIRATVATLRTSERGTDPALAGSADLDELVEEYRRAGLDIDASISADVAAVDGPAGTALHRIVREALANVARHAPTNRVDLAITAAGDEVRLVVADHGRPAAAPVPDAGRFGLVGMRERARGLGGSLDAGPTPDGWRVEGLLPLVSGRTVTAP